MVFQSLTWRGCGDGATSAFPIPFATRSVSSARSRRGISRSWSVGRPGVRTWEPNGRGSRSRGSGTARAAAAGRCTGATATFASTCTTVWRPHPVSRSYCRRSGEIRQRSSGGRTGAQATMASVNGRSAAERMVHRSSPTRRLIDDFDRRDRPRKRSWVCLGHSVPVRTGDLQPQSQDRAAWRDLDGGNAPAVQRHEPVTMSAAKQSGVLRQG